MEEITVKENLPDDYDFDDFEIIAENILNNYYKENSQDPFMNNNIEEGKFKIDYFD